MDKFINIGDRVQVNRNYGDPLVTGKEGKVLTIDEPRADGRRAAPWPIGVLLDEDPTHVGGTYHFDAFELDLLDEDLFLEPPC